MIGFEEDFKAEVSQQRSRKMRQLLMQKNHPQSTETILAGLTFC